MSGDMSRMGMEDMSERVDYFSENTVDELLVYHLSL